MHCYSTYQWNKMLGGSPPIDRSKVNVHQWLNIQQTYPRQRMAIMQREMCPSSVSSGVSYLRTHLIPGWKRPICSNGSNEIRHLPQRFCKVSSVDCSAPFVTREEASRLQFSNSCEAFTGIISSNPTEPRTLKRIFMWGGWGSWPHCFRCRAGSLAPSFILGLPLGVIRRCRPHVHFHRWLVGMTPWTKGTCEMK